MGLSSRLLALVLILVGGASLAWADFGPVWDPVPHTAPLRGGLIYLTALISVGSGAGLLFRRSATAAAGVLLLGLVLWFVAFRVPVIVRAPAVAVTWEGSAETLAMVAAAWVLFAGLRTQGSFDVVTGEPGVRIGRALFALALIPFGIAHLAYVRQTASLVPAWLPAHDAWVYLTGATYIAAGVAILTGIQARLAAALVTAQMGLFTLLVWIPAIARGTRDHSQWSETLVSLALTAAGWVVTDSLRGARRHRA